MVDADRLSRAVDEVVAIVEELGDMPLDLKLKVLGFGSVEEVKAIIERRWAAYKDEYDPAKPEYLFTKAMVEGLVIGRRCQ